MGFVHNDQSGGASRRGRDQTKQSQQNREDQEPFHAELDGGNLEMLLKIF
jgi:hypothetical protein